MIGAEQPGRQGEAGLWRKGKPRVARRDAGRCQGRDANRQAAATTQRQRQARPGAAPAAAAGARQAGVPSAACWSRTRTALPRRPAWSPATCCWRSTARRSRSVEQARADWPSPTSRCAADPARRRQDLRAGAHRLTGAAFPCDTPVAGCFFEAGAFRGRGGEPGRPFFVRLTRLHQHVRSCSRNTPTKEFVAMPVITTIEDLRVLAEKRVPRMFYDYADSGSWTEGTYRANESDFQKIKLRQRVAVNMENRSTRTTMVGQRRDAGGDRADRPDRHAARRRRDPGRARGQEVRHPVHAVDHEHLLDRGRGRGHRRPPVLVPALL